MSERILPHVAAGLGVRRLWQKAKSIKTVLRSRRLLLTGWQINAALARAHLHCTALVVMKAATRLLFAVSLAQCAFSGAFAQLAEEYRM